MDGSKTRYRSIRNGWGWVIAIGWIVYWWMTLDAQKKTALAALTDCNGFINGTKCALSQGGIEGNFAMGVLVAVIVSPCAWIVSHYLARWRMQAGAALEARQEEQQRTQAQLAQKRESEQRLAIAEDDASKARQSLDRGEFIHKLGTVSDFLELLSHEQDASRIANIRLGAAQALRDLTAKHSLDQLSAMVAADTSIRLSLETALRRLASFSFQEVAEVHILRAALDRATQQITSVPATAPGTGLKKTTNLA